MKCIKLKVEVTCPVGASNNHLQLRCSGTSYGYPGDFNSALSPACRTDAEPDVQAVSLKKYQKVKTRDIRLKRNMTTGW